MMSLQEDSMVYEGYKSTGSTINILNRNYPNFVKRCLADRDNEVAETYTDMYLLRIFASKVFYTLDLHNLWSVGRPDWIPAMRNKELNDFLNFIETSDDIQQLLLMSEL